MANQYRIWTDEASSGRADSYYVHHCRVELFELDTGITCIDVAAISGDPFVTETRLTERQRVDGQSRQVQLSQLRRR